MPESDAFFSMCDRLGILIWQDFFMHSNVYPDYDADFMSEILAESEEITISARRHPCLAILCGGNEQLEGWEEWGWSFDLERFYGRKILDKLPELARCLCPELPYVDNSPHGGRYAQSPTEGDCHNWGSYFNAFKDPLFVTETCWTHESYSRPETLSKFMDINVDDFAGKGWFEKFSALTSLQPQNRQPYSNWFSRKDLRSYLTSMEIEQARADYSALSIFRLRSPSNRGIVYWSWNKGGPLFQFGCVDYSGYPMMSYYVVKRLYEPVVIGIHRDADNIEIFVSNESGGAFIGKTEMIRFQADGRILDQVVKDHIKIDDGKRARVITLMDEYEKVSDRTREVFVARLRDEANNIISEDILYLCPFSEFRQEKASIKTGLTSKVSKISNEMVLNTEEDEGCYMLRLECSAVMQMVALESNHKILCSDNYFPLIPEAAKYIKINILEKTSEEPPVLRVLTHSDASTQEVGLIPLLKI